MWRLWKTPPCSVLGGLDNKFHLLADFGGAVLAGRERGIGRGYEFVTWIWDYERVGAAMGTIMRMILQEPNGTSLSALV